MKMAARGVRYMMKTAPMALSVARLGVGMREKASVALLVLRLAYSRGKGHGALCDKVLRLQAFGKEFRFRVTSLFDLRTLKDIFFDGEYDVILAKEPRIIFDFGGNVGVSALYFALKYAHATIYVFEPDPQAYVQLIENTKLFPTVRPFPYALTATDGPITFYSMQGRSESSSLIRRSDDFVKHTVIGKMLDTILEELGIDYVDLLKFDIEGGEWELFSHTKRLSVIGYIVGEVHLDLLSVKESAFLSLFNKCQITVQRLSPQRFILHAKREDTGDVSSRDFYNNRLERFLSE